jgi:spermidine synthase
LLVFASSCPPFLLADSELRTQLYHKWELGPLGLTMTRMLLSAALIVVPSFLMGGTLPLISRYVAVRSKNLQSELDTIYALNTSGGATGALVSSYFLMPWLGITGTVFLACGINLFIFFVTTFASAKPTALGVNSHLAVSHSSETREAVPGNMGLLPIAAFLTGAVSLAYEVVWTHALGFLVGNTVYAFGLMLFTILAGLGLGARLAGRRLSALCCRTGSFRETTAWKWGHRYGSHWFRLCLPARSTMRW